MEETWPLKSAPITERLRLMREWEVAAPEAFARYFPVLTSASVRHVGVRLPGMPSPGRYLNFASSNYLNLSVREEVVDACRAAACRYGSGANGAPILNGRFEVHEALEEGLARFHHTEAATLFPSGYSANLGIISSLGGTEDTIAVDRLAHASIFDGLRLSTSRRCLFAHNDVDDLERRLISRRLPGASILVVTEGVFSMDADLSPLPGVAEVCRRQGALLILDDAHALGVLGATGRGTCEHYGLAPSAVALHMGTLSKTLAGIGGYVAGSRDLIDLIRYSARPALFSANIPPMVAAGCLASLRVLEREGAELSASLRNRAHFFREQLEQHGIELPGHTMVPILPIVLGDAQATVNAASYLMDRGIFGHGVIFPAVPQGAARLRFMVSLGLTEEDLASAATAIAHAIHPGNGAR